MVIIRCDHQPLKYLSTMKEMSQRLYNWWLDLQSFHATIIYRPGKKHGNADAISRLIHTRREEHDDEPEKKTRVIFLLMNENGFMLAFETEWNDTYTMGYQKTDMEIQSSRAHRTKWRCGTDG